MKITGKVTYVDISGGFWGIRGDDGVDYQPQNKIPAEAQKEGAKVSADIEYVDGFSVFMWGTLVKVKSLKVH